MMISSRGNQHVKAIRALLQRRERERTGLALVEGIRLVAEAVQTGQQVRTVIVSPSELRSEFALGLVDQLRASTVEVIEVTTDVFASLSARDNPQGIAAVVAQQWSPLDALATRSGLCWVALEGAQDPGNVGTILRTCDAVGASGLILLGDSVDPYDPASVRASMGAVFSQKLVRAELDYLIKQTTASGYTVVGTSGDAPLSYSQYTYPSPMVLLMGSERQGLSDRALDACDAVVSIPMLGRSDSLNLSVATGVLLYEILSRQRPEL